MKRTKLMKMIIGIIFKIVAIFCATTVLIIPRREYGLVMNIIFIVTIICNVRLLIVDFREIINRFKHRAQGN